MSEKDVDKSAQAIIVAIMILVKIILAKMIFSEKDVDKIAQAIILAKMILVKINLAKKFLLRKRC